MIMHLEMDIEEFNNDERLKEITLLYKHGNEEYYFCLLEENDNLKPVVVKVILYHL